MKKFNHQVRINSADNGIIVDIGCKTLVFVGAIQQEEFLSDLKDLLNGKETELHEKYFPEEAKSVLETELP